MRFVLSCAAARIKHRCGVGWSAEGGASLADASGYDKSGMERGGQGLPR